MPSLEKEATSGQKTDGTLYPERVKENAVYLYFAGLELWIL